MQDDTPTGAEHGSTVHSRPRLQVVQVARRPTGPVLVRLPQRFDGAAATQLTLPGFVDLILDAPDDIEVTCEGLLRLAWRCSARERVDVTALPDDARACLTDWLHRTRAMDASCSLPTGA